MHTHAGHVTDFAVTWAPEQRYEELVDAAADGAAAAAAEAGVDARIEEVGFSGVLWRRWVLVLYRRLRTPE
jgi:peroxiredoxin